MFIATGLAGLLWLAPWLRTVRNDYPGMTELARHAKGRLRAAANLLPARSCGAGWSTISATPISISIA
jgi:hypothetical protein